jgi:hypothetical protein
VVDAPPLKAWAWGVGSVAALAVLGGLALHGERPEPGLVRFEAAGVMRHVPIAEVDEVRVVAGARRWVFARAAHARWHVAAGSAPAGDPAAVERGLRFLNVSAPQRVLEPEDLAGAPLAEFGLEPPRYVVSVHARGRPAFIVHFGALNAQGLAQYARVSDGASVYLLPRFVGEPWEAALGLPR